MLPCAVAPLLAARRIGVGGQHPQLGVGRVHDAGDVPAAVEHDAHVAAEETCRLVGRHPRNDVVALGRDDVVSDIQRY